MIRFLFYLLSIVFYSASVVLAEEKLNEVPSKEISSSFIPEENPDPLIDSWPRASKAYANLFTALEITYSGGRYEDYLFRYRLAEPPAVQLEKEYPMLVWLHGHGERGADNVDHVRWLDGFMGFNESFLRTQELYILAVQCPKDDGVWFREYRDPPTTQTDPGSDEMATVLRNIIERTLQDYLIDADRVYLSGLSAGGTGCWEIALRYPDTFAAVMPISSGGGDNNPERLKKIKHVPIWAFHAINDDRTSIEHVRRTTSLLKQLGGKVYLTEGAQESHSFRAFNNPKYNLLEWMLSQKRGNKEVTFPPEIQKSEPPQLTFGLIGLAIEGLFKKIGPVLIFAFLSLTIIAIVREVRSRSKKVDPPHTAK